MYVVTVEFTIKLELVKRFRERVLQQARDSLASEPDCHVFASGQIRWMHLDDGLPRHQSRVSDETGTDPRVS